MDYTDDEKHQFSVAQERSRQNDLPGTIEILRALVANRPDSPVFCATLANSLKEAGELETATNYFRRAVALAPKSEAYSLGMFHCLWEQGKHEEALEETKRFISISDSADYRAIVSEINEKWSKPAGP